MKFTDSDALTIWAQRILTVKNQLTASDAQEVETTFADKLSELGDDVAPRDPPESAARAGGGGIANLRPQLGAPAPAARRQRQQKVTAHASSTASACRGAGLRTKLDHPMAQHPRLPFSCPLPR